MLRHAEGSIAFDLDAKNLTDVHAIEALARAMPTYGIGNVHDPFPPLALHSLYAVDEDWLAIVKYLVSRAHVIYLHVSDETTNIRAELEAIRAAGAAQRTVVFRAGGDTNLGGFPHYGRLADVPVESTDPDAITRYLDRYLPPDGERSASRTP